MVINTIAPSAAYELMQEDKAILIDVRELAEYRESHIAEAVFLPMSEFEVEKVLALPIAGKALVIHCRSGMRSGRACAALLEANFEGPLYNLEGGILAWQQQKLPLEE